MNSIDVAIIFAIVAYLYVRTNNSFIYHAIASTGAIFGFCLAVFLAPTITQSAGSNVTKGVVSLAILASVTLVCCLVAIFIARTIKMRIIMSPFYRVDKILVWPYRVLVILCGIVLLSQTLIFVPLIGLQYVAQGSTLLSVAEKISPTLPIQSAARKIAPDQFKNMKLNYDPIPLTYNNIKDAGDFQAALDKVSPSIVKISGMNCVGLAFGSGSIIGEGLVVTNVHVIAGGSSVYISDHEGSYPATPIIIDRDHDIAILYSKFLKGKPLPIKNQKVPAGTKAAITGYPGGGDLQMIQGTVINKGFTSDTKKLNPSNTVVTDVALGKGSSGGPMFDIDGTIIGVNDAGTGSEGIAVSSDVLYGIVAKAKNKLIPSKTGMCERTSHFY